MSDRSSLGLAQANEGEITVEITEVAPKAKSNNLARPWEVLDLEKRKNVN